MLELLAPAGSPEAVIAAVQNAADAVYFGFGNYNARRGAKNFTREELVKAIRYCRIRGCKTYITLNTLVNDREMEKALTSARIAAEAGANAFIVQDLGFAAVLRNVLPDMPIHASTQMSIHNLAGVEAAAEMGITRAVLARELSFEQIKFITSHASIETEVFVHGALCFCYSGQCYMSALIGRRSGNRGMCAQPCRLQYSLGGRMDDYPLSLKDNCLVEYLKEIEDAGVACVKIEGRMKRPEYTAIVSGIYSRAIKERRNPSPEELKTLERAFSRSGFTQGYFTGEKSDMFGVRSESDKESEKIFTTARKGYAEDEIRRVPVHFYTVASLGEPIRAIAFDDEGNRAMASGKTPERARNQGLTEAFITEQMYKTGQTPFLVVENKAKTDPGLFLSAADINELRRNLVSELSEARARIPPQRVGKQPALPGNLKIPQDPAMIFQVLSEEQLTPELAELKPAYLYAPVKLMAEHFGAVETFMKNGAVPVAVLPRVITDDQVREIVSDLESLFSLGVNETLVGNMGHIFIPNSVGMKLRADFGLNAFNSYTLEVLRQAGFLSATASFELRLSQIRDMNKPLPTEIIAYGRLPLMVSEQCIIKASSGRCACSGAGELCDRMGSVFPVVREFDCRNVIYNAHKLYLADKKDELSAAGLWAQRMLFSTENSRECVEVAKGYMGLSAYKPSILTRGLYYRGVD